LGRCVPGRKTDAPRLPRRFNRTRENRVEAGLANRETTLRSAGHHVTGAASGQEAVRLFREQTPDVVITDILMPADSIDLVVALRNEHPAVPFIVVSGLAARSVPTLEAAQLLGARRTLNKPFKLAELLKAADEGAPAPAAVAWRVRRVRKKKKGRQPLTALHPN